MAMLKSLCSIGRQNISFPQILRLPILHSRCVVIKASQAAPPPNESFEKKNMNLGRPMSPHLTIYKPQLTSMMSLSHRTSGIILSGYAIILAMASFSSYDIATIASTIQGWHIPGIITFPFKLMLSLPCSYHLFNGIRHLCWDAGKGLTLKEVYITGYGVLGATFLLAFYMALH